VGFGGEFGNSRAPRADGAGVWAWNRRSEQPPRMERDFAAHTTALGTADAAKWVNRQEHSLTQPRATLSMGIRQVSLGDRPRKQPSVGPTHCSKGVWVRQAAGLPSGPKGPREPSGPSGPREPSGPSGPREPSGLRGPREPRGPLTAREPKERSGPGDSEPGLSRGGRGGRGRRGGRN
jgi:hypothetical protein